MRPPIVQSIVLFVGLAVAAAVLMIVAQALSDAYARTALLAVAAALFGAGLTVFLLRITSLNAPQR
jgi:hypothetical protein